MWVFSRFAYLRMRRAYANAAQAARYEIKQIAELEHREDERDRAFKEDVEGGGLCGESR